MRCVKRKTPCPGYTSHRLFLYNKPEPAAEVPGQSRLSILPLQISTGSVIRSQLFSTFLDRSFPADVVTSSSEMDVLPSMVLDIFTRPGQSEMLQRALTALSSIYFGRVKHDSCLFQSGIQQYNIAIRHMSRMLSCQKYTDDMIYTTVLFQVIQVREFGWSFQLLITHPYPLAGILQSGWS